MGKVSIGRIDQLGIDYLLRWNEQAQKAQREGVQVLILYPYQWVPVLFKVEKDDENQREDVS